MSYFIFNETSSEDLGIMVTKPVVRPSWRTEENTFNLVGKSKKYRQSSKTYTDGQMNIETVITDTSPENLRTVFQALNGNGKLWLSSAPNEFLNVSIDPINIQAVALTMGVCVLSMTVDPFAYVLDSPTLTLTDGTSYTEIENRGTIYCEPEIRFKPQSAQTVIDVNGAEFTVNTPQGCSFESTIVLDCEEETAYFIRPEGQAYPCLQYTYGDFPIFHTGKNYIKFTGTNEVEIKVRERCL